MFTLLFTRAVQGHNAPSLALQRCLLKVRAAHGMQLLHVLGSVNAGIGRERGGGTLDEP